MNKHRIMADFHNADEQGRLRLTCIGTIRDVAKLGISLHDGMELVLVDDDLEVEGVVEWNPDEAWWVAAIDWDAIRDVPVSEHEGTLPVRSGIVSDLSASVLDMGKLVDIISRKVV